MTRLKRKKDVLSGHELDIRFGTPREVAEYRAERLCRDADTIIEVGAGAGFQTASFAARVERVIAIDIDAERLGRGVFAPNVTVILGDALDTQVIAKASALSRGRTVIFLDPERPSSSRARALPEVQPSPEAFVDAYAGISDLIAIELPPFLPPSAIPWRCEREYVSVDGQLNRLTVYLGGLRHCDLSVVALPGRRRLEHEGETPRDSPGIVRTPKHVVELDKAISHTGLAPLVLPKPYAPIGKAFLVEDPCSWGATFKVITGGDRKTAEKALVRYKDVILHGTFPPEDQRALLKELNALCRGSGRAHLFVGERWYVTERG